MPISSNAGTMQIVIAEHAVDRAVEVLAETADAGDRLGVRAECLSPVIAGEH